MYNIPDSGSRDTATVSRAVTVPLPCRYRDAGCAVPVVVTKLDGPTTQTDPASLSMEAEIMQLVSEAYISRHARDNQQNQLMRNNAAAVREAILAQSMVSPLLARGTATEEPIKGKRDFPFLQSS